MIVYLDWVSQSQYKGEKVILDTAERQYVRLVHEIKQSSGGTDQNVAAHLEFIALITDRRATVNNTGPQHRPVTQTSCLIENLCGELPSRGHNQHKRLSTHGIYTWSVASGKVRTRGGQLLRLSHQLRKNGNQKSGSFSRA
jgi:hypothetical protein